MECDLYPPGLQGGASGNRPGNEPAQLTPAAVRHRAAVSTPRSWR